MNRFIGKILVMAFALATVLNAGTIAGKVTDSKTGKGLAGANIIVEGTSLGAAADANGIYHISNVPNGDYTVTASMIGFEKQSKAVKVTGVVNVNFTLSPSALQLSALEVMASRATRNTPVAYTNVEKSEIEFRLGSQDIPMVLNLTPSVYATMQGGGAGDARVNVRGFNQRNIAVMINGVPVNDMENGWVYWSNWDGVADATSSIQMQRGLSAVNLATPSIGGTMNIITDPSALESGGKFKQEVGEGNFKKTTLNYNTGLINEKYALSATIVRKTGDGFIDKTWTDAWSYYIGASYALNANNRFEFYALGAPQRHGQNRYRQNIAVYDAEFAKSLDDYDEAALGENGGEFQERDRYFNQNWAPVNSDYNGQQYWYMYGKKLTSRFDPNFLNERENYFHKPQVNLNWYWTINDKTRLSNIFYYSGGSGGGTGTYGKLYRRDANGTLGGEDFKFYYGPSPWVFDWNETIAMNSSTADTFYVDKSQLIKEDYQSMGILRNSINRQWTLGAISKLNYDYSDDMKFQFGVDWRTAEIEHAREVRDLLGGDYYMDYGKDEFNPEKKAIRGDIINYHNTNTVDWFGLFGQTEYNNDLYSLYGMVGYSMVKYSLTDHFKKAENHPGYLQSDKGELYILSDWITSFQIKGGGLYRLNSEIDVFANFGNVEKVPIFDNVIDDINSSLSTDPKNERFISTELGLNYRAADGKLTAKVNLYNTNWEDRTLTKSVNIGAGSSGDSDIIFLRGLNQNHKGLEVEVAYKPIEMFRLDGALSVGSWEFTDDAKGTYKDYETGTSEEYVYTVKGLKVGDMPQTMLALGGTVYPVEGLSFQAVLNWYDRHYADWDPVSRELGDANDDGVVNEDDADRAQSWQAPGYMKIDLHGYYDIPVNLPGVKVQAFLHIFNALDEVFVQDAQDNSQYNAYDKDHDADDAEVYLGLPRSFNAGLTFKF